MRKKNVRIGQVLLQKGVITDKQLDRAIAMQKQSPGKRLGDVLIDMNYVSERTLAECLAEQLNCPYVELANYPVNARAAALLDHEYAARENVLPIDFQNNRLLVATADPLAYYTFDDIEQRTGQEVMPAVVRKSSLPAIIEKVYSEHDAKAMANQFDQANEAARAATEEALNAENLEGTPLDKLITSIIMQAALSGASDIHIEPTRTQLQIRLRINGDLVPHTTMTMASYTPIATRIKLMADMNIAERRVPQDGKFHFQTDTLETDIRASSLPTIYGEKIVLRLLGNSLQPELMDLNRLGMNPQHLALFNEFVRAPNGIILVTGPTGSGKTTTLYASLNQLTQKPVNIVTIEDPVEQRIDNVNQVQVNPKADLTFGNAMRSILRQDPDVIMVGEMRDNETAGLAMRAAITGHLVLSTLHTNDTVSSIVRMLNMECEPYMVAAALTGVVAQRLVKKLCPHCKEAREATEAEKLLLGVPSNKAYKVYNPVGCRQCHGTGYTGRMPVYEMIKIDDKLRNLITSGANITDMKNYERSKGTQFLSDSVKDLVLNGSTSIAEMEKIIYSTEN